MSAKHQSLQEWHAAGGGVPVRFKGKEHIWHKQVEQHLGAGGSLIKAAAKAAKVGREVLPAVEREANLAKMLEGSKVKERMYHGTDKDFPSFNKNTFLTFNPEFAEHFPGGNEPEGQRILPVYVNVKNPWDYKNRSHVRRLTDELKYQGLDPDIELGIHEGDWASVEHPDVINAIKQLGHDGVFVNEIGNRNLLVFKPEKIKSAIGNRGTYDTTVPDLNEAHGGAIHLAGGGDPRKRAMYPKMPTQAIIESPGFDPDVPSDLSRAYARRMADKAEYERNIKDQKLTPTQRGVAGLEAAGMLGSAMFEGVQQLPKLLDSKEAYEQAVGKGMYQPRFQPEKAAEYVGNVGDFLEQLETKYKMPQVLPELLGMAPLADAAKRQAGKAVKQGALTAASRMDAGPKSGSMAAQRGIVKMPGGNWLDDSVEKGLDPLKRTVLNDTGVDNLRARQGDMVADSYLEERPKTAALNNWVDRNLTNYVKKQMATPDDPVRKLAEQDITHFPIAQDPSWWERKGSAAREDMGGTQMAESDLAKQWENRSDAMIQRDTAQEHQDMMHLAPGMYSDKDEWIKKLPPETNLYKATGDYTPFNARDLGFDHIMDVLKQDVAEGRIRPEQLSKVSMEQAVRRTYEYDQEMAKKMRETAIKQTEGMPVHKEYPEGYKWIELAMKDELPEGWTKTPTGVYVSPTGHGSIHHPNFVKLNEALDYEGKAMGHCVGSYCPDVASKKSRIYSLRDAKGEPHVTIEVTPGKGVGPKEFFMSDLAPDSLQNDIFAMEREGSFNDPHALEDFIKQSPEYQQYKQSLPPKIEQIRGKGNAVPKKDYLPFVQDFVKGGNWSDVEDLRDIGLTKHESGKYISKAEMNALAKKHFGKIDSTESPETYYKRLSRYEPELLSEADKVFLQDWKAGNFPSPEEGMKAGGRVNRKHFHEPHLSVGGDLAKIAAKSAKAAKPAAKAAEEAVKEMSMAEKIAKARQAAGMAPTARIGLPAPGIIVPGKLNNVREAVRNMKGNYGARRVERAADEIPNLERMFTEGALGEAFTGDNARGLMTIDPADFEKYAQELSKRTSVGPEMAELAKQGDIDKYTVPTDEYIKYLQQIGGFSDVPYLNLFKDEVGLPNEAKVIGHEGRHRNRALANQGQPASLVQIQPRGDLREGMPRRTQEDFIEALKQELDAANRLVIPESEPYFRRPSIQLPDVYAEGGEVHMSLGGDLAKVAAKSAKTAKPAAKAAEKAAEYLPGIHYADPLKPPTMKFSEALGNAGAEGKKLNFTEADRSRVFGSNRGGVGFAGLQHYSEPHKEANTVWGFGNKTTAEKKIRQNDPENTIWTTFVGAPNQHKSNSVVLQDAFKEFNESLKSGKATPHKIELMNERLRSLTDKDTGLPVFDADFDISDPDAFSKLNSFARRGAVGDVFLGEGVKGPMRLKTSPEKWQDTANMEALLRRETDPDLIGAGTYDVGNRLFMLDNGIIERPDLNAAFPWQVTGTDLGMKYEPVPMTTAMRDWAKQYEGRKTKSGKPAPAGYMDLARNNPSQFVSDEYLTWLQKQGKKAGGLAQAKKPKKVARHGNTVPN